MQGKQVLSTFVSKAAEDAHGLMQRATFKRQEISGAGKTSAVYIRIESNSIRVPFTNNSGTKTYPQGLYLVHAWYHYRIPRKKAHPGDNIMILKNGITGCAVVGGCAI